MGAEVKDAEARKANRCGAMAGTRGGGPAAGGGAVYGLGMIGALVYFLQVAGSDRDRLLAFPMAMVWPAILVYRLFRYLGR